MKKILLSVLIFQFLLLGQTDKREKNNPPIYIAFLWHMHQPIYWPYESIVTTQAQNRFPYSVFDIHNQRIGPYTSWPKDAVQKGISAGLPNFGAQVSFSGSLVENLNNLEANGNGNFSNWKSNWNAIKNQKTSLGNPRLDMVGFGYFHPLMGLIDYQDIRKQIQMHKETFAQNFPGTYSKGIFPPENAFSDRMIPALVDEGIEWALVDNIHFERAVNGYPFDKGGNIYESNKADVQNENPNDWIQLNGVWAGTKVSAKWARQPHYVENINPETGEKKKIIAIPADRYLGNEDGRGGFGALDYENVMSQFESSNNDSQHPILLVLHHDGDNYGGGSSAYYDSNFQNFVEWLKANPQRFVCTTIQDYLAMFPPDQNDVIHVEDGSWSGADNGDPEFKKWLGDPGNDGYSPDHNSWGVITAAKNYVQTANQINATDAASIQAWKYLLAGEASDYWYWDGSIDGIWDSHPARAANLAVQSVQSFVKSASDLTPPTIFTPQREPYNPGGTEWLISQSSDFKVWSYVYDISGLKSVTLKFRTDNDGINPSTSIQNEKYSEGDEVSAWQEIEMAAKTISSRTSPAPIVKAKEYSAEIKGFKNFLLDYYIEADDSNNNIAKSDIKHVWVGDGTGTTPGNSSLAWHPNNPKKDDTISITLTGANQGAKLHWGVNGFKEPYSKYWPEGTTVFTGGQSVETPFVPTDSAGIVNINIGPFNDPLQIVDEINFVIHYDDNTWDNNSGNDYKISLNDSSQTPSTFIIDGALDTSAKIVAQNSSAKLHLDWNGTELYVATESAKDQGKDVFLFLSADPTTLKAAPWAKQGSVGSWAAYIANESTNNYCSWYDQSGTTRIGANSFLEGTINLQQEFGTVPSKIYLAVGLYGTSDDGALVSQIPTGNNDGNIDQNEFFTFDFTFTGITANKFQLNKYALEQNYPNPFNPETVISWQLAVESYVTLKVFDILGNEVTTLVNEKMQAGVHKVIFNGAKLSSGIYFYQMKSGAFWVNKKMILLK